MSPKESSSGPNGDAAQFHMQLLRQGVRCIRTEHHWRWLLPDDRTQTRGIVRGFVRSLARWTANALGVERETGWIRDAARACAGLTPEDIDLVLASGPPFVSFGLAMCLCERLGRPYVLDYRAPWTKNADTKRPAPRRIIERERRLVERSVATMAASAGLALSLSEKFGSQRAAFVISDGFDPEESDSTSDPYPGMQDDSKACISFSRDAEKVSWVSIAAQLDTVLREHLAAGLGK